MDSGWVLHRECQRMLSRRSRKELVEDVYVKLHGGSVELDVAEEETQAESCRWKDCLTGLCCLLCCRSMEREKQP